MKPSDFCPIPPVFQPVKITKVNIYLAFNMVHPVVYPFQRSLARGFRLTDVLYGRAMVAQRAV